MSIYTTLAIKFINNEIDTLTKISMDADASYSNQFFSYINLGRDQELSRAKRELLILLKHKLNALCAEQPEGQGKKSKNDETQAQSIKELIEQTRLEGIELSKAKKMGFKHFSDALDNLINLNRDISMRLHTAGLLNKKHDQTPLNIFRYYVGYYFIGKVVENKKRGYIDNAVSNPNITNREEIEARKENVLFNHLQCTIAFVEAFGNNPDPELTKKLICDEIMLARSDIIAIDPEESIILKAARPLLQSYAGLKNFAVACLDFAHGSINTLIVEGVGPEAEYSKIEAPSKGM